jgi:hypothetical protein
MERFTLGVVVAIGVLMLLGCDRQEGMTPKVQVESAKPLIQAVQPGPVSLQKAD